MFTIEYIANNSGIWLNKDKTIAKVLIKFIEFEEVHEHTAVFGDTTYSNEIISKLKAGEAGTVKSFEEYTLQRTTDKENEKSQISNRILELKPDVVLPTDADFNGDGEATLTELQILLDLLLKAEEDKKENEFKIKYGI